MFKPRPGQKEVIDFTEGKMGVSAVPGSGKTQTLSYLAARLVASQHLSDDQEILIVTLVNSAVDNFANRVSNFLREFKLIPGIGYRVRTLHGLAYDIVRENPDLVGLDNLFTISDERTSKDILTSSAVMWIQNHRDFLESYATDGYPYERNQRGWLELLESFASSFIKQAKDMHLSAEKIRLDLKEELDHFPLIRIGCEIFTHYQNALINRGAVDFEDLVRFAYRILANNKDLLERLRYRWPIILEDEAQDSSLIQEQLLRLLCGENGNWVRMGDTNQAIFETFTTADPRLLRNFLDEPGVIRINLPYSGRSSHSIISLANQLVIWCNTTHPTLDLQDTLTKPLILPTLPGDPQQNPQDAPDQIYLFDKPLKPDEEIKTVARLLKTWVKENPEKTVAVLVPRNIRGSEMASELDKLKIPFIEMLNTSQATRDAAKTIRDILIFYAKPNSKKYFTGGLTAILKGWGIYNEFEEEFEVSCNHVHQNIPAEELLEVKVDASEIIDEDIVLPTLRDYIISAVDLLKRWQKSVLLPIDQMIMTIAMDLFSEASDLALAHKLAVILKNSYRHHPDWELPEFCEELNLIIKNRYKLYGFSSDDLSFDPECHKGKVIISTIHKAKGLEWDRVYLMSVNNYDFPSALEGDQFISEKWFVRGKLNLEAEVLSQLKALAGNDKLSLFLEEGVATENARLNYAAERLRLLYVGITRAREQLIITWNTGRQSDCQEAIPLQALRSWWENRNDSDK